MASRKRKPAEEEFPDDSCKALLTTIKGWADLRWRKFRIVEKKHDQHRLYTDHGVEMTPCWRVIVHISDLPAPWQVSGDVNCLHRYLRQLRSEAELSMSRGALATPGALLSWGSPGRSRCRIRLYIASSPAEALATSA